MENSIYVWLDGKLVRSEDANVHILTHSLQYGSGIFEGIRIYSTNKGPAVFRLREHLKRFVNSAKIYSMNLGYSIDELEEATLNVVRENKLDSGYIRPFAFYNDTNIGLSVQGKKVSVAIAAVSFGSYYKDKDAGIKCKVSTWHRINSNILPTRAKASGNYINSIIATIEAKNSGADDAILLSANGYVAEGSGENIFLVKDNVLITPSEESDILVGITRDSVIKMAKSLGIEVKERLVHKEELYTCDELFFTGTAAEVTPILSVDSISVGNGMIGQVTKAISEEFSKAITGQNSKFAEWLTFV